MVESGGSAIVPLMFDICLFYWVFIISTLYEYYYLLVRSQCISYRTRAAVTSRIIIICVVDPGRERQRVKCLGICQKDESVSVRSSILFYSREKL